jgi:hypothetical protein
MEGIQEKSSQKAAASAAATAILRDVLHRWPRLASELTQQEVDQAQTEWSALIQLTLDLPSHALPEEAEELGGLDLLTAAGDAATEGEVVNRELWVLRELVQAHLGPKFDKNTGGYYCPICEAYTVPYPDSFASISSISHELGCYWAGATTANGR